VGQLLPGEFAIRTWDKNTYLSGLPHTGTVITAATTLGSTEKFKLTAYTPEFTIIQTTSNGFSVTVAPEGGLNLSQGIPENSLFTLKGPMQTAGLFNILTRNGPFLSAVDGGGQTSNAFLTDVTVAQDWEAFWVVKSGDLGSGYRYIIRPKVDVLSPINFLTAPGGGGRVGAGALTARGQILTTDGIFTVIQAVDGPFFGGYALQTANGFNYVTAVDGGGLASGDNLHTDATRVRDWEIFRIVDQGDATYTIQTLSGFYLAVATSANGDISTRIDPPDAAPEIGYTAKFEFIMLPNQLQGSTQIAV
jgi:hypothetical protein